MKKIVVAVAMTVLVTSGAWAQGCSVCTKTAQGLDDKSAKGLNGGIVYLAFLPAGIMFTLGYIWWRSKKSSE